LNQLFSRYFAQVDLLERIPKCFLILAAIYFGCQFIGYCLLFDKTDRIDPEREPLVNNNKAINSNNHNEENSEIQINSIGVKYEDPSEGLTILETIKVKQFYYLAIIACLSSISINLITLNYKLFGQTFIHDDKFLALCGSVAAILNASSRLFWGAITDMISFKVNNFFMFKCSFLYMIY